MTRAPRACPARPVGALTKILTAAAITAGLVGWSAPTARADPPLLPDREQARAWAGQELLRPEYQRYRPSAIQRLWEWLRAELAQLSVPDGVPGNLGTAIVAAALIALLIYLLWRTGGVHPRGQDQGQRTLFEGAGRTAAEHRTAADAAHAAGDHRSDVLERFRGLVRGLQERALLELDPGRTADEAAAAGARWLPELATDLAAAARIFDEVRYGDLPATPAAATKLRDLDEQVQRARPQARPTTLVGGPELPR